MPKPTKRDTQTSLPVLKLLARLLGRSAARELTTPLSRTAPNQNHSDSGFDAEGAPTDVHDDFT